MYWCIIWTSKTNIIPREGVVRNTIHNLPQHSSRKGKKSWPVSVKVKIERNVI